MKRLTRDWFRKEVVACATLAEIKYDGLKEFNPDIPIIASNDTYLSHPGRLAYCHIFARCYGNRTDVFVNSKYLTTIFRR